jgi:predicted RNA-binding Zn-ribbon protein involved in translation (DUF1610 family)
MGLVTRGLLTALLGVHQTPSYSVRCQSSSGFLTLSDWPSTGVPYYPDRAPLGAASRRNFSPRRHVGPKILSRLSRMVAVSAKHTCPHCGAVYDVRPEKQCGRHTYRTAVCSHCGDVMAEWDGCTRRYRRIKRPARLEQARKLVEEIAAARASRRKGLRSRSHRDAHS